MPLRAATRHLAPGARCMLEAIGDLPEDEQEVFGLVRFQGLTQAQVQSLGGLSVTVKWWLNPGLWPLSGQLTGLYLGAQPPGSV